MAASWRRTLTLGALSGLAIGVGLPMVLMFIGGALALVLGDARGNPAIFEAVNRIAPLFLFFLDLPHTLVVRVIPGHADSLLLALAMPPLLWAMAGAGVAVLVHSLVRMISRTGEGR